jgi:radical SAM superfamily enzyme YgiQ (UPF0313 family)
LTLDICNRAPSQSFRGPDAIVLISCYELGHQPIGIAQPAGFLEQVGYQPSTLDIAVEDFDMERIRPAVFAGISVPMHTALRLGVRVAELIRKSNLACHICFYGLYASLNAEYLLRHAADSVIGGEYEIPLLKLIQALELASQEAGSASTTPAVEGVSRQGSIVGPVMKRTVSSALQSQTAPISPTRPMHPSDGYPATTRSAAITPAHPERSDPLQSEATGTPTRSMAFAPDHPRRAETRPLPWPVPGRRRLPALDRYAHLERDGQTHKVGYVEASRGCLHHCLHCPIVPVYQGRFFLIPKHSVLEDIRNLAAAGARHITFGDPDFLNGPGHSMSIVRAMHAEYPFLTFDFTAKIEHVLKHCSVFPELASLGCIFVVSAVESFSDLILAKLHKGHTRADIIAALAVLRSAGITLRPSFVAFTPWTTLDDYLEMFQLVESNDLIDATDPVQLTIRLLIPPGSALLSLGEIRSVLGPLDEGGFQFPWSHPDRRLDQLHARVSAAVEDTAGTAEHPEETFRRLQAMAYECAGRPLDAVHSTAAPAGRLRTPRLTESWFCCAEPTQVQFRPLRNTGQSTI